MPPMPKYRYGSSYSSKPKNWLRNILPIVLLGIPLVLLALELGLKNFAPIQWLGNKSANTIQNYELKLVSSSGADLTSNLTTISDGDLQVKTSPISGYDLVPNQTTKFWQINAQGFRLNKLLPVNKERDDIRIFIIGNSTAFGTLAANNQMTLAPKLERLLNNRIQDQIDRPQKFQPATFPYYADQVEKVRLLPPRIRIGKYQVITAAIPGYTSTNQLSLLVHKLSEFNPDCLIFLDGYEDLRQPSSKPARELINLEDLVKQFKQQEQTSNEQRWQNWLNTFYIVKVYRYLFTPTSLTTTSGYYQVFNANQLTNDARELKLRVANYDANLKKIANLNTKIPIVVALQPEITGKSEPTNAEIKILKSLGQEYSDRITKSYKALEARVLERNFNKIKVISFYKTFDNTKAQIFVDPIHLTDAGNNLIAKKLLTALEDTFKLQSQPAPER